MKETTLERWYTDTLCPKLGCEAKKYIDPGERGAADRIVLTPYGIPFWAELKRPTKELRAEQERWAVKMRAKGYFVIWGNSREMLMNETFKTILAIKMMRDGINKHIGELNNGKR